jgi:hypothetical protein
MCEALEVGLGNESWNSLVCKIARGRFGDL